MTSRHARIKWLLPARCWALPCCQPFGAPQKDDRAAKLNGDHPRFPPAKSQAVDAIDNRAPKQFEGVWIGGHREDAYLGVGGLAL